MKRFLISVSLVALLPAALVLAGDPPPASTTADTPATSKVAETVPAPSADAMAQVAEHRFFDPADLKWVDAPPSLPKGAKVAVLEGDLASPGPFTMRVMVPAGYKVAPHWHPGIEHLTVLSGTFSLAMGEAWDESKGHNMTVGSFSYMPAGMKHFAWSKKGATFQIHGVGPWGITYVNPQDDPRNQKQATK